MKIKKFNENFNIDNEEIKMMFYEYLDSKSNSVEIEDKFLVNNEVVDKTPYIKDSSKVRHCKLVTILIGKGDGIKLREGNCMTNFDLLEDVISQLKRFYSFNTEDMNFIFTTDYMGLTIKFVIKGDFLKSEDSRYQDVEKYLNELKEIIKSKANYRVKISNNWLEMSGKNALTYREYLYKVKTGAYNRDHILYTQSSTIKKLVDWYESLLESGLSVYVGGGDNQLVVKIKLP